MTSRTSFSIAAEPNTIVTIQPDDERRAWATQGAQLTELIQNLYSIVLYDLENDQTLVSPGLDPAGRTSNAEYFFRVPPKTHEISEPFATTIQGTQGGGDRGRGLSDGPVHPAGADRDDAGSRAESGRAGRDRGGAG